MLERFWTSGAKCLVLLSSGSPLFCIGQSNLPLIGCSLDSGSCMVAGVNPSFCVKDKSAAANA